MKRANLMGGATVVLIVLVVGGAFLIGRTLGSTDEAPVRASLGVAETALAGGQPATKAPGSDVTADTSSRQRQPVRVVENVLDVGDGPVSVRVTTLAAPELPHSPSDVHGVFVRREDNSLIVGTGAIELNVEVRRTQGGAIEPEVSLGHDGPEVEVVVTHDTVIYREETEQPGGSGENRKGGEYTVEQVVKEVDSLDELGKNTEVMAWGSQRGDRVVAEILVYRVVAPAF